jgi:regulator of sigma E protease
MIIIALIIFGVIVTIHEFGHFFVARLCNIKVNKFAIGMGPVLFKWGKKETEYSLRLLPIGGFCSMEGENESSDDNRAFVNKNVWQRIAVVSAGAIMNILLGFVLLIITTASSNAVPSVVINSFHTDENNNITAASYESGLREGDKIISIDGSHIFTTTDLAYILQTTDSKSYEVKVKRDGEKITLDNVKFFDSTTQGKADFYVSRLKTTPLNVIKYSACDTIATAKLVWTSLIELLTGKYGISDMSGPVGVVSEIGEAASSGTTILQHLENILSITVLITINIGIFNLLPIPALDGGRLLFLAIEVVIGKSVPQKYEAAIHMAGMAVLMLLIVVVTINDVTKLF